MELPVLTQADELLASVLFGAALGLAYDLLRPLRGGPVRTGLTDLLFCLLTTLTLLAFTLYCGRGRLRLFALAGMAAGSLLWFLSLSRPLRLAGAWLWRLFAKPLRAVLEKTGEFRKNISKFAKKLLHLPKNLIK